MGFVSRSQPRVALHLIVKQMMALTRATGAVIAMRNERSRITCLASAGRAPGIGAVLKPDSGLSGECVRSGDVICCDDAAHDTRVDVRLAETLGFRSMIVFPLRVEGRVVGVLEVLSAEPQCFKDDDISVLGKIAELVLDVYEPLPATAEPDVAAVREPEISFEAKPPEAPPKLELVKPRVEEGTVAAPKQPEPPPPPKPIARYTNQGNGICDACGHQNSLDARDCEKCDVPLPLAIEMEAQSIKRKPVAFEIPERDDRLERLVSALWRPVLLLIVLT